MSVNEELNSMDKNGSFDVEKLSSELCFMTGCDEKLALMQLSGCGFDLQLAAEKILESMPNGKQLDDGWQTINRQKKFKKKEFKPDGDGNGDGVKYRNLSSRTSKSSNSKSGNFKNDERQNYLRSRNKRIRNPKKPKENSEFAINNNKITNDSDIGLELNDEELRWDNVADIEGGFKESDTNSVVDCFYSDDDFGFPTQSNDDAYQEVEVQMLSSINNIHKINQHNDNYSKSPEKQTKTTNDSSQPNISDSKLLNECLSDHLPIFGKFSKTELPKSLSIVPNEPVSFAVTVKSRTASPKFQYNFGVNMKEFIKTPKAAVEYNFMISKEKPISMTKQPDSGNLYNLNHMENKILSSNNPNFNNIAVQEILQTICKQKEEVAMLLGQHPAQNFYPFSNQINLIPMANPNPIGPMYSMQMHPDNLHADIENGMTHRNQECFMQNSFPTSINMSVPFHLARK